MKGSAQTEVVGCNMFSTAENGIFQLRWPFIKGANDTFYAYGKMLVSISILADVLLAGLLHRIARSHLT